MPVELSDARSAVWDALDNWPALADTFEKKFKFDGSSQPETSPHADQLPAIELYPVSAVSKQFTNRQHEEILTLAFLIYTATWDPSAAETIVEQIRKALWQSTSGSGGTYIQAATGSHPLPNLAVDFERGYLPGNQKATLTTFQFELRLKHDPLS